MNFKETAQCSGTVTGWNFCFFNTGPSVNRNILEARFIVYRRNDAGSSRQVYTPVPNSMYNLVANSSDLPEQGCSSVMLNTSQQFQILENDIMAACVLDNYVGDVYPLFVTSSSSNPEARQIRELTSGDPICTDQDLSMIDLSDLSHRKRNILHLFATIGESVGN